MKVHDKVITIESFGEARDIAYAPISADYRIGSCRVVYAARRAGIMYDDVSDYSVNFLKPEIEEYFSKLIDFEVNHKLSYVDFQNGQEITTRSWWPRQCILRSTWHDSRPRDYLRVVRHVIQHGLAKFKFHIYDDYTSVSEACVIENRKGVKFTILRTVDPNLFDGLIEWINDQQIQTSKVSTAEQADAFIG